MIRVPKPFRRATACAFDLLEKSIELRTAVRESTREDASGFLSSPHFLDPVLGRLRLIGRHHLLAGRCETRQAERPAEGAFAGGRRRGRCQSAARWRNPGSARSFLAADRLLAVRPGVRVVGHLSVHHVLSLVHPRSCPGLAVHDSQRDSPGAGELLLQLDPARLGRRRHSQGRRRRPRAEPAHGGRRHDRDRSRHRPVGACLARCSRRRDILGVGQSRTSSTTMRSR